MLLIEDDAAIASGIGALLELEGIEVRVSESGRSALDVVRVFQPDAIVLDLTLPDMDGMEVYAALRSVLPDVPIILSTGRVDTEPPELAKSALLRKPYEFAELLAVLRKFVA